MQQTQEATKKVTNIPTIIDTPTGLVVVWESENVSKRMIEVLGIILSHDAFENIYHGVKSVVFRTDGYPKEMGHSACATYAPDTGGIAINMVKTLERALDRSMDHPETSLLTSWWLEMLLNFNHEIHHGVLWDTERDALYSNTKKIAEEEERAEKYAESTIQDLAKEYDIECPNFEDEPWFNYQIMELLKGKGDEWSRNQEKMLKNNWLWKHEPKGGEEIIIHSFKDFVCLISNGDIESPEWNKPTIQHQAKDSVSLDEQINGKKITINADGNETAPMDPHFVMGNQDQSKTHIVGVIPIQTKDPVYNEETFDPINMNADFANDFNDDYDNDDEIYQAPLPVQSPPVQPPPVQSLPVQQAPTDQDIQMDAVRRITEQVYMKMYDFIFKNCGPLKDSDVGFSNPEAVLTSAIPLTDEEKTIFVSMDHNDPNGRWCPNVSTENGLLGKVMKNTRLPSYEVGLVINGLTYKRLLIPQNPAKRRNGQLTQRALEARAGNAISYIKDQINNTWGPYMINGEYRIPKEA